MKNTFGKEIVPDNDALRVKALRYYNLLNNLPDKYFTNLAHIIAETFDMPIALISLVDEDTVFFKGNAGMEGVDSVDRGESLCSLAILDSNPTVFQNTLQEPCLMANPLVMGDFGLRFYAGAPIVTKEGFRIGTVCVVDKKEREFTDNEQELLVGFAKNAMHEIDCRSDIIEQ